jgi:serine/threonine-protein kinase RsbT
MTASKTLLIRSSEDVVRIRSEVRNASITAGFSLVDQTKFVTAASENGAQHGNLRRRR